jgi:tetratricopeptide (TPR) repeat protein
MAWAVAHEPETAARIAVALRSFWEARGHWTEATTWLDRCRAADEAVSPAVRVQVLCGASSFARLRNAYDRATSLAEEGLALARVPGVPVGVRALALNNLGNVALDLGQYTRSQACYLQSMELYESVNDNKGIGDELNNLGVLEQVQGRFEAARALFGRSLAIHRQIGDTIALPVTLTNLGANACFEKDYERAAACHAEALSIRREIGDRRGIALSLSNLGIVAYLRGDLAAAEQWCAEGMFLAKSVDDQFATAKILLGQGRIAVRRGKPTEGMHLLTQALMILQEIGSRRRMADVIEAFAAAAATNGRYVPAAQLFGAAETARASYGSSFRSMEALSRDSDLAGLRDRMGEASFRAVWEEGLALPLEEAVALALSLTADQPGASAAC